MATNKQPEVKAWLAKAPKRKKRRMAQRAKRRKDYRKEIAGLQREVGTLKLAAAGSEGLASYSEETASRQRIAAQAAELMKQTG